MFTRDIALGNHPSSRGAVLVAVLGLIFIITIIVGLFVELQTVKLREAAADYRSDDLRVNAYGALETTLAVLHAFKTVDGQLYAPAQGWSDPLKFAPEISFAQNMDISVTLTDESGRRSLNKMTEPELVQLLEGMQMDIYDSQILAQSLLDWIDPDDLQRISGAEKDHYERENLNHEPPNRNLVSYDELRYVRGFAEHFFDENGVPNSRFEQLKHMTTLHEVNNLNLNTASGGLIATLGAQNDYMAQMLQDQLAGFDGLIGTEDDTYLKTLPDGINLPNTGTVVELLRIRILARRGEATFRLEALVQPVASSASANRRGENASYPFSFVQLRENQPIP